MTAFSFFVAGEAKPQGSMTAFPRRHADGTLGAHVTHANAGLAGWRFRIAGEAQRQGATLCARDQAVAVSLMFVFARPPSLPKRRVSHTTRPDLDKLARAALDALTDVIWFDDAQVAQLECRKVYGPQPGLHCTVSDARVLTAPVAHVAMPAADLAASGVLF